MNSREFQIDLWNVGQGDATTILLEKSNNTHLLDIIDVGPANSQFVDYICSSRDIEFKARNIILTHNDIDHCGAMKNLLKQNNFSFDKLLLVADRPNIFDNVYFLKKDFEKYRNKIFRLEASSSNNILDQFGDYELTIAYPDMIANEQHKKKPNTTSAIIQLFYIEPTTKQRKQVMVWAADEKLSTVYENVEPNMQMLFGPHHGGPQDKDKEKICKFTNLLAPKQCFLSFATKNKNNHPDSNYINALASIKSEVVCSQCSNKCSSMYGKTIFNGDGAYGLKTPGRGNISCHGHVKLILQDGILTDEYASEYAEAKKKFISAPCKSNQQ